MHTESNVFEIYYPLLWKYLAKCPSYRDKEEYQSFVQYKFCQIVDRCNKQMQKGLIKYSPETYISKALSLAIKFRYYTPHKYPPKIIYIDPTDYENEISILEGKENHHLYKILKEKGNIMDEAMLCPIWISEVGHIDLRSDLLKGLCLREICFMLLWIHSVNQERIAKDFKVSIKTVQRVLESAKQKIYENARRMNYGE
jgi:hypothetical protein